LPDLVIPPRAPVLLPVEGSDAMFPVGRIFCVGRNYADHAREMGGDAKDPPFFFQKQPDMAVPGGGTIAYPPLTANFHYEAELVLALGAGGADVPAAAATALIWGYAAGIDFTRRDRQNEMKQRQGPWEIGKSFDASAPCGAIMPAAALPAPLVAGPVVLTVNGAVRQSGDLARMTWSPAELIAALSRQVTVRPGDLIFTGTPEGVGPAVPGDRIVVTVAGLPALEVAIGEPVVRS